MITRKTDNILTALAGTTAGLAYLDAKFHVRKDIKSLLTLRAMMKDYIPYAAANKRSLWYRFEESVHRMPADEPAAWTRETGDIGYAQFYKLTLRYANWLKDDLGVRPGEFVAFYLMNSLEFLALYLATWAIGAAPSMINYNLSGQGLVHCLKMGSPRIIIVDEDEGCQARIQGISKELDSSGLRPVVLDRMLKGHVATFPADRPGDEWRAGVQDGDATILLFTRYVRTFLSLRCRNLSIRLTNDGSQWHNWLPERTEISRLARLAIDRRALTDDRHRRWTQRHTLLRPNAVLPRHRLD